MRTPTRSSSRSQISTYDWSLSIPAPIATVCERSTQRATSRSVVGIRTVDVIGSSDTERPSIPGAITVDSVVGTTVNLSWGPATDNVEVAGYRVYDFADQSVVAEVAITSATFDLPADTYQLYVKAFDAAGNESFRTGLRSVITS